MSARRVASAEDVKEAGDWFLDMDPYPEARYSGVALFCYRAPDGVLNSGGHEFPAKYDHIYIRVGPKQQAYWQWDGSVSAPTIAPSIQHLGNSNWHGFFEAGNWRTL
jgi:hypothetical protein